MNLKQLIEYLEKKDPGIVVPIGFADPHSYRGDYNCLGLEPRKNVTVGDMLVSVRDALGNVYQGWKGGDYQMGESTEVYLAMEGSSGEKIGTVLLDYMTGVYDGEHIGRCNDSVKSLTTANVNLESALASADAELFEYRKKIVDQSKAIHDLTEEESNMASEVIGANREITRLRDTIKDDRRRIASQVKEISELNRWFINDRDTLRSIERIWAELGMYNPDMKIRDVKAIKSMRRISDIMEDWDPSVGRDKESEDWLKNGEDILSMATNEIRDIEVGNLKTINSLLRANIENMNKEKVQVGRAIKELCGEIEYLKDSIRELEDELASAARSSLDYSASIFNRDSIIEGKNVTISQLGNRIDDQEDELKKGYEDITSLKVEVNRLRDILRNEHDYNTDLLESIRLKCHKIVALESKLSACKEDSVVLKKVVDVIKDDTIANIRVPCMICSIVDDYLDATSMLRKNQKRRSSD